MTSKSSLQLYVYEQNRHSSDLLFPPDPPLVEITSNTTTNVTAGKITLRCEGRGNPPSYDYQWIHLSVYNELIRTLSGDSGGNLELPPPYYGSHLTYGDSGLYVCSVSNGVTDENGHVTQNGTTALVVESKHKTSLRYENTIFN